jgi:F-type H+-transporting ATPase subunit a
VSLVEDTITHHGRKHVAMIGTFGAFILCSNLLGLIPSFATPTSHYSVTLPLALMSFVYYNQVAIRTVGVGAHLKHMAGPLLVLAPLIFPIELVGHVARVLSLSMRLFGNMYGEHSASGVFYGFFGGFLVPLPMMALGVFGACLQTFIFVLLSTVYIALATEGEH